jgi:hypothetical protein
MVFDCRSATVLSGYHGRGILQQTQIHACVQPTNQLQIAEHQGFNAK